MAREIIERLVDDLDGGAAAETVVFGLDGATYEIDLSKKNAAALRTSLDRFVNAARRNGPPAPRSRGASSAKPRPSSNKSAQSTKSTSKRTTTSKPTTKRDYDVGELRAWAATNGIDVPARGRIPQATVEQYTATLGR